MYKWVRLKLFTAKIIRQSWQKILLAWPDDAVLKYQGDGTFFWHTDRVNPTSSDDEDGIFRSAMVYSAEFFYGFPFSREGVFRKFSVNLPMNESKSKPIHFSGLQSFTLPLRHTYFLSMEVGQHSLFVRQYFVKIFHLFSFVSTLFIFVRLCFPLI